MSGLRPTVHTCGDGGSMGYRDPGCVACQQTAPTAGQQSGRGANSSTPRPWHLAATEVSRLYLMGANGRTLADCRYKNGKADAALIVYAVNHIEQAERERDEALRRAEAAEAVCVMYGWSALAIATPRQRVTSELWKRWAAGMRAVGIGIGPKDQPDVAAFEDAFLRAHPAPQGGVEG